MLPVPWWLATSPNQSHEMAGSPAIFESIEKPLSGNRKRFFSSKHQEGKTMTMTDPFALKASADSARDAGKLDEAIQLYDQAIALRPQLDRKSVV